MKKILLLCFYVLYCVVCFSQWPHVYGQNSFDIIGRGIIESYDHGYYICGGEQLSSGTELNCYIYKTDINGNILWKRYIKYPDSQYESALLGISQSGDGGVFVSGQYRTNMENSEGFFMKLDACGEKQWCGKVVIPGYSYCQENITLSDDNYLVLGTVQPNIHHRVWLYKMSSTGECLWMKEIDYDSSYVAETGLFLLQTIDSNILITGFANSFRDTIHQYVWRTPLYIKMDYEGNQIWDLPWFTTYYDYTLGDYGETHQDKAGNYYSGGAIGDGPGQLGSIYKFSPSGQKYFYHTYEGFGDGSLIKAVSFFPDSTLFLGGAYAINENGYSMVIKSDTSGNIIKSKNVPLYGMPIGYSATTYDSKILGLGERPQLAGYPHWETVLFKFNNDLNYDSVYTSPITYDSLCPGTISPNETIYIDCEEVGSSEAEKENMKSELMIYPNPVNDLFTIQLPDTYVNVDQNHGIRITTTHFKLPGEKDLAIMNMNGQIVHRITFDSQQKSFSVDASGWAPGMYLVSLIHKNKVMSQGKLLKR